MTPRLSLPQLTPDAYAALTTLATTAQRTESLEPGLLELVRIRASQLNGCTYCLHLHTRAAQSAGETPDRLAALPTFRTSPLYTARERAALTLTESITLIAATGVPDEVYAAATSHFTEQELAALIWAVTVINTYNRLAITTRPG
jgi:AhpD family alkylhydroperoxidase